MSAPWLKFFPSDWRADPALRMCSIGARGLWMEMICVMHEAAPYGSLRVNGRVVTDRQIAALAGASLAEVSSWLEELESAGVFSRDDEGAIVSRRMMRDKAKAETDKDNGKRGGNPGLRKGVNPSVGEPDKAQKPEARSQSSDPDGSAPQAGAPADDEPDFRTALFRRGLKAVCKLTGKADPQARTAIGRWLRDCEDEAVVVLEAIDACVDARPADPMAWITGAIRSRMQQRGPPRPRLVNSSPTIDQHGLPIHEPQRPRTARAEYTDALAAGLLGPDFAVQR